MRSILGSLSLVGSALLVLAGYQSQHGEKSAIPRAGNGNDHTSAGGARHGFSEFESVGINYWTVPEGVTTLYVELWGGAGGGGGGGLQDKNAAGSGGGGGGTGAYIRTAIEVVPGDSYVIRIGKGGRAGDVGEAGRAGGRSSFETLDGSVLSWAGGGKGGKPGGDGSAVGGDGGNGGIPDPAAGLKRNGRSGLHGLSSAREPACAGPGGAGLTGWQGSVES